jgi:hypothetical protein
VTAEPGAFRVQPYEQPFSTAFTNGRVDIGQGSAFSIDGKRDLPAEKDRLQAVQSLVDDFRAKNSGGTTARVLPAAVAFPAFGGSIFLMSELTAENKLPIVELTYQRDKKKDGGK